MYVIEGSHLQGQWRGLWNIQILLATSDLTFFEVIEQEALVKYFPSWIDFVTHPLTYKQSSSIWKDCKPDTMPDKYYTK